MSQGTGTTRNFQDMLNEYLPNKLLAEELIKRDYVLTSCEKDPNWKGGKLIVPFKGAGASSVAFGKLTDSSDIAQSKYVRGSIDNYVECWSSIIFNQRDLMEHDGKVTEDSFLRILPDEVDSLLDYNKQVVSVQLTTGPHFATVTDDTNKATGVMVVDHVDRFQIGQKCVIDDANSGALDVYVIAINVNTKEVTFSATRGGAFVDLTAYTVAQSAKLYHDGVTDGAGAFTTFTSMRSVLLSAANGGTSTVHGVSKLAYPILQAVNVLGSSISASNLLDKLFDAYNTVRQIGKGNASEYLMSLKHMGTVFKLLQAQKGPFLVQGEAKRNLYGWTELTIAQTTTGQALKLVGIQEMDDDVIFLVDWSVITLRSNGMFKKRKAPDGKEYFETRAGTGYQYIVDICLFAEMEYRKPGHCAVIYSISY